MCARFIADHVLSLGLESIGKSKFVNCLKLIFLGDWSNIIVGRALPCMWQTQIYSRYFIWSAKPAGVFYVHRVTLSTSVCGK